MCNKYVLGLDLGVASIGWSAVLIDDDENPYRILDNGVMYFTPLDNTGTLNNVERRDARGKRRVLRRKQERLNRLKNLFMKSKLTTKEEWETLFNAAGDNIIELKVKGCYEQLTEREIVRCLYHYAKNRGFKSNRKNDKENETGKLSKDLHRNTELLKKLNMTPSELIIENIRKPLEIISHLSDLDEKEKVDRIKNITKRYKNTTGDYRYSFNRGEIEEEIIKLLETQMKFTSKITAQFINDYLEIWNSQRDYSDGPASGPYQVSWENTFGRSKFTNEICISKATPAFERFRLLQKLQNFRYRDIDQNGKIVSLTTEQINQLFSKLTDKAQEKITYAKIAKEFGIDANTIVNLPQLSRSKFIEISKKYTEKLGKHYTELTEEEKYALNEKVKKERLTTEFTKLPSSVVFQKNFENLQNKIEKEKYYHFCNEVATVLSYARTDEKIKNKLKEKDSEGQPLFPTAYQCLTDTPELLQEIQMLKFNAATGTGNLDLNHTNEILKYMLEGNTYPEAMEKTGYKHYSVENSKQLSEIKFPTVKQIEEIFNTQITNPNVRHMFVNLRKLYNSIVKKHGVPRYVHIETAREIANGFKKRNEIKRNNIQNYVDKQEARAEAIKNKGTLSNGWLSANDELRVRLWRQQEGKCMYSGQKIDYSILFTDTEIDHILPYSKSFDNSQNNKVVVLKSENQEKRNRTPYEWMNHDKEKWLNFKERVELLHLPRIKAENLLTTDFKAKDGFLERYLHATSYTSKLAVQTFKLMLKDFDVIDDEEIVTTIKSRVKPFKGGITSLLRKNLQLNDLTHSYEDSNYSRKGTKYRLKIENEKDVVKKQAEPKYAIKYEVSNQKVVCKIEFETLFGNTEKGELTILRNPKTNEFKNATEEMMWRVLTKEQEDFSRYIILLNEGKTLFEQTDQYIYNLDSYNQSDFLNYGEIVSRLYADVKIRILQKNRDNHLHHIVDATLLAINTISIQQKLTKHVQKMYFLESRKDYMIDENGEVITRSAAIETFKFEKEIVYNDFKDEIKYRIFERDEEKMREGLRTLSNYKDVDVNQITVKYPKYMKTTKTIGRLHKDTVYGTKHLEKDGLVTRRKAIADLKKEDFEKIYNVKNLDGTKGLQYELYEVLIEWDKNGRKGDPILKNGNPIHKVKIVDYSVDKMIQLGNGKAVMIDGVDSVEIYKKENDDNLYFVQISSFQRQLITKGKTDFNVVVWWGRGSKKELYKYTELLHLGYQQILVLEPGDTVDVMTKNMKTNLAVNIIGFSSGLLEVDSLIGDQLDVVQTGASGKIKERIQITISTIMNIQKIKISNLGEMYEL